MARLRAFWAQAQAFFQSIADLFDRIEAKIKSVVSKIWKLVWGILKWLPPFVFFRLIAYLWKKGWWGKIVLFLIVLPGCWFLYSNSAAIMLRLGVLNSPLTALTGFSSGAQNAVATLESIIPTQVQVTPTAIPTPQPFEQFSCEPVNIEVTTDTSAEFFDRPGRDNKVLFTAQRGAGFISIGRVALPDGSVWIQVEVENGFAWVFALNVTRHGCQRQP